jgi:hypothetical protein
MVVSVGVAAFLCAHRRAPRPCPRGVRACPEVEHRGGNPIRSRIVSRANPLEGLSRRCRAARPRTSRALRRGLEGARRSTRSFDLRLRARAGAHCARRQDRRGGVPRELDEAPFGDRKDGAGYFGVHPPQRQLASFAAARRPICARARQRIAQGSIRCPNALSLRRCERHLRPSPKKKPPAVSGPAEAAGVGSPPMGPPPKSHKHP